MKKLTILVVLTTILASCAVRYKEVQHILDYRPHTSDGFVISPALSVNQPHTLVGSITVEFYSGLKDSDIKVISGSGSIDAATYQGRPQPEEMLGKFIDVVKSTGANGVVGISEIKECRDASGRIGLAISGYAVKIQK